MGTSGYVGQNPRTESGFIGTPGGVNLFKTTAELNPEAAPATPPKGIRVRNKKTGQTGVQLPDGTIIPDAAQ